MSTRFYFDRTNINTSARPAIHADWDASGSYITYASLRTDYAGYAANTDDDAGHQKNESTNPWNGILVQAFLPNLAAQTISGTVKGQFRAYENAGTMDCMMQGCIRVLSRDGLTVRGTLIGMKSTSAISGSAGADGYELNAGAFTNRKFPSGWSGSGDTVTSVTAQAGDMLVVEIGFRSFTSVTGGTAYIRRNFGGTTDLPEDETTTTSGYNNWIEFSANIAYNGDTTAVEGAAVSRYPAALSVPRPPAPFEKARFTPTRGQLWPRGSRPN